MTPNCDRELRLGIRLGYLSVLPEWGDRRSERWDRWRRENGHKSGQIGRNVTSKDRREMLGLDNKAHIYDKDADG